MPKLFMWAHNIIRICGDREGTRGWGGVGGSGRRRENHCGRSRSKIMPRRIRMKILFTEMHPFNPIFDSLSVAQRD